MDGDGIVQRLIVPAGIASSVNVGLPDRRRIGIRLLNESVKCAILLGDGRYFEIVQDRLDERAISEQLRRDRGVGADSERTVVEFRRERRDQLPLPRRER